MDCVVAMCQLYRGSQLDNSSELASFELKCLNFFYED